MTNVSSDTKTIKKGDIQLHTNAILDTSTGTSLIREEVADLLEFGGIKRKLKIKSTALEVANFSIISENNEKSQFNIEPASVMRVLNITQMKI